MSETATIVPLWQGPAPLAIGDEPRDVPSIEFVMPTSGATGACVLVCPGGGYQNLAAHEGRTVGEFLASHGIVGAVLKSRIGPRYKHPAPKLDVCRAMRLLRHRAGEFGIDAKRIAVLGFSAGGHLASTLSTQFDAGDPGASDAIERQSCRPDASVLCYPVITMSDPHTHKGSRNNLLGADASAAMIEEMSSERRVTRETPPTFVWHTVDDEAVPVENALLYVGALRKAGVPFEAHLYETGRHGVGLASDNARLSTWGPLMVSWLRSRGW